MNIVPKHIGCMAFALAMGAGVTAHAQSDSIVNVAFGTKPQDCLLYTSPSPRDP